jgi:hypothetical protein
MNGFGLRPLPAAMASIGRPDATEVSFCSRTAAPLAAHGELVAVLDQEPVCVLASFPIVGHADQDKSAVQPIALQRELEIALRQRLLGGLRSLRFPITAIPQHDRAAAILTLGDRPFEVAIIERMIFNLDGKPFVTRVERGTFGQSPGFETAQDLKTPSSSSRKS